MIAVILAAGQGTRLRPYTDDRPKCLVELAGRSLLDHQISTLHHVGITDITVVGGYRWDQIERDDIRVVVNDEYDSTNMVESLFCAKQHFDGSSDVLICYGDIVYEPRIANAVLGCDASICLSVDLEWKSYWELRMDNPLADAETLKMDAAGMVVELGKKPKSYQDIQGQYMGLLKVRADQAPQLEQVHKSMDPNALYDGKDFKNMYMTSFLQHLIDIGWDVKSVPVKGGWLEVDTGDDLALYHGMHEDGRLSSLYDLRKSI